MQQVEPVQVFLQEVGQVRVAGQQRVRMRPTAALQLGKVLLKHAQHARALRLAPLARSAASIAVCCGSIQRTG